MSEGRRSSTRRGRARRTAVGGAALVLGLLASARATQDAVANGDTRTISIVHQHTKESGTITFRRNGRYDSEALNQLNWLLRDWRRDEPTKMDPRLFDILWEVTREVGASEPVHVVSAYRAPETNSMLRRRSRGVAKHSQHMAGKAMDFYLPDADMARVRAVAMRLQHGGVGYYPSAHNPFVHLDAGSVRSWPRMTRDQLARLFPSGRTVHLPADGKPMEGYEEARAEIVARGGTVAGYASAYAEADEGATSGRRKSLWASLFGGGDDEDTDYYQQTAGRGRGRTPAAAPTTVAAYAPTGRDDAGVHDFFAQPARGTAQAPERRLRPAQRSPAVAAEPTPAPVEPPPASRIEIAAVPRLAAEPPAEDGTARLAIVPLPPKRPDLALADAVPLPPTRPVALAGLGITPLPAPTAAPPLRGPAEAPRAAEAPRPAPAAPRPLEPAQIDGAQDDRAQLRALFAAVATGASEAPRTPVRSAKAQVRPVADGAPVGDQGPVLRLGFAPQAASDLGLNSFKGPAVKALPVLR